MLTGPSAARALQAYMGVAARGVRFDSRRIASAAAAGRLRGVFRKALGAFKHFPTLRQGRAARRMLRTPVRGAHGPTAPSERPQPGGAGG